MKISGYPPVAIPVSDKNKRTQGKTKVLKGYSETAETTEEPGDRVDVGDHVETLSIIKKMVANTPDIRLDEVDRITRQLKSKKYKINFEKVAEGFIKEAILTEIARRPKKNGN